MIETIQLGSIKWYHILYPSEENLNFLSENFDFHPLDIEDCRSRVQRPKIDVYEDYYFMILHFPYADKANKFVKTKEVKIFWGKDYVITIGKSHWVVKNLFNEVKENPDTALGNLPNTSDILLYSILEALMKETMSLLTRIDEELDLINREIFNIRAEKTIERISVTRKNLILINTIFRPQLRVFQKFESGAIEGFAEEMEEYWGNILDYYQKMWDMIEDYEELIEGFSKTFDSLQANRTNQIMKILTFISTIMLPLSVITGMYGMNVALPMGKNPVAFYVILSGMVLIMGGMMLFFKRKKWM
ncbi:MAG TPA: magnesium transporter CorA family protein [Bacteroidales bacterium]|nr:magnesium transporter CorA family protein [Bacteroidales bacterium]HRZ48822.1 magnesium transporter CorA family protein [Bacteroidales bacterium]